MIIKAWYKLDNETVKAVRFDADSSMQPLDKEVIYSNAPGDGYWDECIWDHGRVEPKPKKRAKRKEYITEVLSATLEISDDSVD
tara:strand:- start:3904 stop:4155 length:252 start_codon:yes stop_codon:yes gene_type:complete